MPFLLHLASVYQLWKFLVASLHLYFFFVLKRIKFCTRYLYYVSGTLVNQMLELCHVFSLSAGLDASRAQFPASRQIQLPQSVEVSVSSRIFLCSLCTRAQERSMPPAALRRFLHPHNSLGLTITHLFQSIQISVPYKGEVQVFFVIR